MSLIEIKDLSRKFKLGDEELNALDSVNLSIEAGQFVAIVGPSGSGKSTLANIIGGLDRPNAGSITVDSNDLSKAGDHKLSHYRNKTIGFVFQSFNLQSNLTALENVMVPLMLSGMGGKERKARATECLQAVGLGERLKHKPSQLSGGQRQRVCIARALANNPSIILADEPTGNLDSSRGKEIMDLLVSLNKQGITLIVITHDTEIARRAGRVVAIRDGKLSQVRK
jgi:putative ABC transport system ATP-binding protein